ncbi:hypothetical protein LLEC1_02598 [Akanthomyces lecanii]|uniref:Uncharacterized protein n=1 Tax=Cordyceps confragosa TaxID=2714763 RepID=A0A179IL82_CORDF|nr:hypothetical protein LLEC1_02598 [Akanthomyces lecanii]
MTLKRKRSSPELPSSPMSFSSAFSPPPSNGPSTIDSTPRMGLVHPCHLNSRTLKRLRDNRPSQEEIHRERRPTLCSGPPCPFSARISDAAFNGSLTCWGTERTLELLYTAQQQCEDLASPCLDVETPAESEESRQVNSSNQQSLHRFWDIRSQPTAAPGTSIEPIHMVQS